MIDTQVKVSCYDVEEVDGCTPKQVGNLTVKSSSVEGFIFLCIGEQVILVEPKELTEAMRRALPYV
jgi:hypothetical protein